MRHQALPRVQKAAWKVFRLLTVSAFQANPDGTSRLWICACCLAIQSYRIYLLSDSEADTGDDSSDDIQKSVLDLLFSLLEQNRVGDGSESPSSAATVTLGMLRLLAVLSQPQQPSSSGDGASRHANRRKDAGDDADVTIAGLRHLAEPARLGLLIHLFLNAGIVLIQFCLLANGGCLLNCTCGSLV